MYTSKDLLKYTSNINILYVEDDDDLRESTLFLFEPYFKHIDTACDGLEGLNQYNNNIYDIVITDINMPNMNGLEMISKIKEINPEQKIIAISAHNEPDILLELIKSGISSFILKPIIHNEVIDILYPVSRDAYTQILNLELVDELNEKNTKLEQQIKQLKSKSNTIDVKHKQIEKLIQKDKPKEKDEPLMSEYFKEDISDHDENVIFLKDHADDILEYFQEITDRLSTAVIHSSKDDVLEISNIVSKISSILLHYSPYLDDLSVTLNELSLAIKEHSDEFMDVVQNDGDSLLILFDAVTSDMERYVERFSKESLAMENAHHIQIGRAHV